MIIRSLDNDDQGGYDDHMTTNAIPTNIADADDAAMINRTTRAALHTAACAILDDDTLDTLDAFRRSIIELAAALELCPMHACDAAICADDDDMTCIDFRD